MGKRGIKVGMRRIGGGGGGDNGYRGENLGIGVDKNVERDKNNRKCAHL